MVSFRSIAVMLVLGRTIFLLLLVSTPTLCFIDSIIGGVTSLFGGGGGGGSGKQEEAPQTGGGGGGGAAAGPTNETKTQIHQAAQKTNVNSQSSNTAQSNN